MKMSAVDTKLAISAPCGKTVYDKRREREVTVFPAVDCGYLCETCDWNPLEHERRLKEGKWQPCHMRVNQETGKRVALEDVQQLVFGYPVVAR